MAIAAAIAAAARVDAAAAVDAAEFGDPLPADPSDLLSRLHSAADQSLNELDSAWSDVATVADASTLLAICGLLLLILLTVIGVCAATMLVARRLFRYARRVRRKSRLRNFDKCISPATAASLIVEADGSRRLSAYGLAGPAVAKSRRFHSSKVFELPVSNGGVPQIRISISSGRVSPDRPLSSMSNNSSMLPPWTDSRSSIATPGSPASFSSFSAFHEPLLGDRSPPAVLGQTLGFWHRVTKRHIRSSYHHQLERQRLLGQVQQQFLQEAEIPYHGPEDLLLPMGVVSAAVSNGGSVTSENGKSNGTMSDDDRDIDARSVAHYELGCYEKAAVSASCFRGTLTYQLRYDFIHRVLMLHVIRANNLPTSDGAPDPYVKMYCLPERRHHCKTSIMKKSSDPEFNEMFSFDVPYNQLAHRMLQFTVYDFDRFTRHGLVGNVIMRDLFDKSDLYNWTEFTMQILGSQEKNDFGDLLLYLAYSVVLKKLYVTVAKAYNLRPMDITGASDPYVKVELIYQRRRVKQRKTSIKRANLNPVYHECLEFDLLPQQIHETNLLIQVMDWDRIGRDDLLGCCVVGKESPTRDGRQQWEQCFAGVRLANGAPVIPHSTSVAVTAAEKSSRKLSATATFASAANGNMGNGRVSNGDEGPTLTVGGNYGPIPMVVVENGSTKSAPATAKCSTVSGVNGNSNTDGVPRAVGTWHSILGEVPEGFRNIPKAKK